MECPVFKDTFSPTPSEHIFETQGTECPVYHALKVWGKMECPVFKDML